MNSTPGGSALASMTMGSWAGHMWQMNPKVWLRGVMAIGLNYPTGLALLYIPGVMALRGRSVPARFRWAWLAVIGVNLAFAISYRVPDQQSFFIPTYAAAGALIGLGAAQVFHRRLTWAVGFALAILVVPVYALLPTVLRLPAVASRLPLPRAIRLPTAIPMPSI